MSWPSLSLALRALWFRRGVSLAVLLVATVTTAAAAAGPLYLRAGSESVLRDGLSSPALDVTGLDVVLTGGASTLVIDRLTATVAAAGVPKAYPQQIRSLQMSLDIHAPPDRNDSTTRMMWREGACAHLHLVAGHCPVGPARSCSACARSARPGGTSASP